MTVAERMRIERLIIGELDQLQAEHAARVARAIMAGKHVDDALWARLSDETRAVLSGYLRRVYAASAMRWMRRLGLALLPEAIERDAETWAATYTERLAPLVTATARERIENGVADLRSKLDPTEDLDPAKVDELATQVFGSNRAASIAATETTRAETSGGWDSVNRINSEVGDEVIEARWITADDDRTCWICNPLHNTDRDTWGPEFPEGPPAHPGCRCSLTYERRETARGRRGDFFFSNVRPEQ